MNDFTQDLKTAEKLVGGIKIPPAPEILSSLNLEFQKDFPDIAVITRLIEKDTSISALMIKAVNSSMFGLRNKIGSISHAISLLGLSYTINIITGIVLKQTFDSPSSNSHRFWESQSNIAFVSANLCGRLLSCCPDEAYLVGLFHNAGHSLINLRYQSYEEFLINNLNHPEASITQLENEQYKFDHTTLGYYLASSWGIPDYLRNVISNHHNVEHFLDNGSYKADKDCEKGLMAILKIAEHVDNYFNGMDQDHEWQRVSEAVLGYLSMSEVDFTDLRMDLVEQLEIDLH